MMYMQENQPKMQKKSSIVARRAWNTLHLTLLWARKRGMFGNRVAISFSILHRAIIRKLRHSNKQQGALIYGDRQFSFDDTPIIHVKMHRPSSLRFKMPNIPCINPHGDFEFEDDDICCGGRNYRVPGKSFNLKSVENVNHDDIVKEEPEEEEEGEDYEGIDLKAEQFIAKFYEQMKMQRQTSYLQYNHDTVLKYSKV